MNAPATFLVKNGAPAPVRPSHLFGSFQREIDHVFEDFMPAFIGGRGRTDVRCKVDFAQTDADLELTVELPGLEEKDVNVTVSDGFLTVSGEKKFQSEQRDENYFLSERAYGAFSRSIDLPKGVQASQIKASMAKGVLKISIPTPAKSEPEQFTVRIAH